MLSRLFLKIIKIKIADCVEFHLLKIKSSVIYNYIYCFKLFKNHKNIADCVEFHIENLIKNQMRSIFFSTQNISNI